MALSFALVFGAAACDDNPIDEGTDEGAILDVNPAIGTINAGGEITLSARVLNEYGAPTYAPVSAEPCSGLLTVVTDSLRLEFEPPERFRVRAGAAKGTSCVTLRGGGLTKEIPIRIVPAEVKLVPQGSGNMDVVGSGNTVTYAVQFLTTTGAPATGFDVQDVVFASSDTTIGVIDAQGNFTARAPGVTTVSVVLAPSLGAARESTRRVEVEPGVFSGTAAQVSQAGSNAALLELKEGAIPFDDDLVIQAFIGSERLMMLQPAGGSSRQLVIPFGTPAGTTINFTVANLGPGQVASAGTFVTTAAAPAQDSWTAKDDPANAPMIPVGQTTVGSIGDTGSEDLYRIEVTEAGTYRLEVGWNNGSDIDAYVADGAYTRYLLARETSANPEVGTVTLQPGIYIIDLYMYDAAAPVQTVTIRLSKQ